MPARKTAVAIERMADRFYIVWIDATLPQLANTEGIDGVQAHRPGKFNVQIDPRYDVDEVLDEIRNLA